MPISWTLFFFFSLWCYYYFFFLEKGKCTCSRIENGYCFLLCHILGNQLNENFVSLKAIEFLFSLPVLVFILIPHHTHHVLDDLASSKPFLYDWIQKKHNSTPYSHIQNILQLLVNDDEIHFLFCASALIYSVSAQVHEFCHKEITSKSAKVSKCQHPV